MKLFAALTLAYGVLADFEEGGPPGQPPTPKTCDLAFTSGSCSMWGDPHTNMFNGKEHDIMGQPMVIENGNQLNGFYYVARCHEWTVEDMPVQIIGVHYPWTTEPSTVTGVDYFTLELYRDDDSVYYLYFGAYFQGYAVSTDEGVSFDYDKTKANGAMITDLTSGQQQTIGALGRYKATYIQHDANYGSNGHPKAEITLLIDDEFEVFIELTAQEIWKTNVTPNRRRMSVATITIDDAYRCASCGLCGSFKTKSYKLETCDGGNIQIGDGYHPWAFRKDGVTWEYNHHNNNCAHDDSPPGITPLQCTSLENEAIEYACEIARESHSACCESLPNNLCDQLETTCAEDVCQAVQMDNGINYGSNNFEEKLNKEVQEFFVLELENQCEANAQGHLEPCAKGEHGSGDADLYLMCDNEGRVEKDGVVLATFNDWPSEQKIVLINNSPDTVVSIFCKNVGGPGGLIATVECENDPKEKYSTAKNGDIPPVSGTSGAIVQTEAKGWPWHRNDAQLTNQAKNAKWIWDGSQDVRTIEFQFTFGGRCGLAASAIQPQPVVDDQPIDDEPERFYEPEEEPLDFPAMPAMPANNGDYILELTKTDLVILMLVLANLAVLGATTCMCLSSKKQQKYSPVKHVYDTTDDEVEEILVE